MTKKWGHEASLATHNGTVKLYCCCGWQTEPVPTEKSQELMERHVRHTGFVEKQLARKPVVINDGFGI